MQQPGGQTRNWGAQISNQGGRAPLPPAGDGPGMRVDEYAYYVNKLGQNVGLETWMWRHKQPTPNTNDHHVPLNETPPWKFSAYATGGF